MSAAHRATFKPAIVASSNAGGYQSTANISHERNLPSHKQLKRRTDLNNQSTKQSGNQDDQISQMKRALEARERLTHDVDQQHDEPSIESVKSTFDQAEQAESLITQSADAAEEQKPDFDQSSNPSDQPLNDTMPPLSSDDEEEDDEEQIRRELEAIREERRIQREQQAAAETAAALAANPLVGSNAQSKGGSKRKFDSGTVFKSATPIDIDEQAPKRFLNDAIRSDQHRSFMKSYIR